MADEALRVGGVGSLKDTCPFDLDVRGVTEVDRSRGMEADPRVAVLQVVLMWVIVSRGRAG